ncbi:MAG TPA: hypothetical protein VGK87_02090, partial [Anaerolineae bacterium]
DVWEDMLLLVLMNLLTLVCGLPLFAGFVVPAYVALGYSNPLQVFITALVIGMLLSIPLSIPYAGAYFALNAVCNRVANGFAISWEFYFSNFRKNLWTTWRYLIFTNVVGTLIVINFAWYPQAFPDQSWVPWVMGAWLAAGIFWTAIQFYVIPFYVEQEDKSWRIAFKNGAIVAGANPLFTFLLLVITLAVLGLSLLLLPPVFVLLGLLLWVMVGTQGVINRVAMYRSRLETEEAKKQQKAKQDALRR